MATSKTPAKKTGIKKVKGAEAATPQVLLHQLILRNIDRSPKDIADWRLAHRMAEAVVNPSRRKLYDLFDDVVLDGHLSGIWKKRVSGVANKNLFFGRDGKKDDSFDTLTESKMFRRLRKKRMEDQSHGIVGFEFIPGASFTWQEIPRKHIKPSLKKITIEQDGNEGFDYETTPNIIILEGEEPFGFLLKAAPYVLFKKGNYGDWAQFVEIFGQPVIITKYDGYDDKTRSLLASALEEAGSSLRLMLPKQADFEMLDGKTSNGDGKLQDAFKNALNNELSILVVGNTETSTSDNGGSNAKSQTHAAQQLEITKDDMEEELIFFNDEKFLNILKMYGFNTDGVKCQYETEVDNEELKGDLDIDTGLDKLGIPLGHDYYYEKYHRPKPANYDELVKQKQDAQKIIADAAANNANPADNIPAAKDKKQLDKKKKEKTAAAIAGLSFLEKVKALFWEAR